MKVKEYGYEVKVRCRMCGEEKSILVNRDDWDVFNSRPRPLIQDIFPYLTSDERELLMSNICPECWAKIFPPEEDEDFE